MSLFTNRIGKGQIKSLDDLKSLFRSLAIELHPDTSDEPANAIKFAKLREDYEEALGYFPIPQIESEDISREALFSILWDIQASNFPLPIGLRVKNEQYTKRVEKYSKMLDQTGYLGEYSFLEVENELNQIRLENRYGNSLLGDIRMILNNVVTWHISPSRLKKEAINKWLIEIEGKLKARGCRASYCYLSWLISDIENGSAFSK